MEGLSRAAPDAAPGAVPARLHLGTVLKWAV